MEVGSRRILHYNVTAHPTADWTLQQFREAIPSDHGYQFLIHDRDSIFSREVDQHTSREGRTPDTPVSRPIANLRSFRWQPHCQSLYQTPMAA